MTYRYNIIKRSYLAALCHHLGTYTSILQVSVLLNSLSFELFHYIYTTNSPAIITRDYSGSSILEILNLVNVYIGGVAPHRDTIVNIGLNYSLINLLQLHFWDLGLNSTEYCYLPNIFPREKQAEQPRSFVRVTVSSSNRPATAESDAISSLERRLKLTIYS